MISHLIFFFQDDDIRIGPDSNEDDMTTGSGDMTTGSGEGRIN